MPGAPARACRLKLATWGIGGLPDWRPGLTHAPAQPRRL